MVRYLKLHKGVSKAGPSAWDFLDSTHFLNAHSPSANLAMMSISAKSTRASSRIARSWFHRNVWLHLCIRAPPLRVKTSRIFSPLVHPSNAIKYKLPSRNAIFATSPRQRSRRRSQHRSRAAPQRPRRRQRQRPQSTSTTTKTILVTTSTSTSTASTTPTSTSIRQQLRL